MRIANFRRQLPSWKSALLALLSAVLLILAFPNFEIWFLALFALVPLMWAVEREKVSVASAAALGWIFGVTFFFGTCWWLAYAPIHYAGFPAPLAYFLVLCAAGVTAVFPAIFTTLLALLLQRIGSVAFLATPFLWVSTEFLRYWITGNNWNSIGYSLALDTGSRLSLASVGGVYLVSFYLLFWNAKLVYLVSQLTSDRKLTLYFGYFLVGYSFFLLASEGPADVPRREAAARLVAVQPDVPMSGLNYQRWQELRDKHVELTESSLISSPSETVLPTTVVFPESPMNFMYEEDPEFRSFVSEFAERNRVSVLFNSAEPDPENKKYFNSAVLVDTAGREVAQYDKIYLLPFGEAVPAPLQSIVPAFVGSFSYGKNYNLIPLGGDAKAGVMICFESHFGGLSREYVRRGADVVIEMTNDGYLGPTPVLRQHLANAVFRAVETNRPVLRVTNVGITAYINERGEVLDATQPYTEDSRVWGVSKSDGSQTFYVKYGDWFAWLCTAVTLTLLTFGIITRGTVRNN